MERIKGNHWDHCFYEEILKLIWILSFTVKLSYALYNAFNHPVSLLTQCILLCTNCPSSLWQNCHFVTVRPTSKVLWKSVAPTATLLYTFSIPFMDFIVTSPCSSFLASSPAELRRQHRCILNWLGLTFRPSYFPLLNFSTTGILHEFPGLLTSGSNYSPDIYSF